MASQNDKLEWMYKNATESVDREEYLLGRSVDKAFEGSQYGSSTNEVEKDCLPPSIFSATESNIQVDIIKKRQEDPLEAIRQKEIEMRKQLLKNPIKLKKLQNMLKEQRLKEGGEGKKKKKKHKKEKKRKKDKSSSEEEGGIDLDQMLASKYMKLLKKFGPQQLEKLQKQSDDESSSDEESEPESKKKKKSKSKGSKDSDSDRKTKDTARKKKNYRKHKRDSSSSSSSDEELKRRKSKSSYNDRSRSQNDKTEKHRVKEEHDDKGKRREHERDGRRDSERHHDSDRRHDSDRHHDSDSEKKHKNYGLSVSSKSIPVKDRKINKPETPKKTETKPWKKSERPKLSEEEKERKRREMMDNAKWRDEIRTKNVKRYREEEQKEKEKEKDYDSGFMLKQMSSVMSIHGSVEERIKSSINNIQRTKLALDKNFAKR